MAQLTEFEKRRNKVYRKTIKNMRELGTYRKEFESSIKRYAAMCLQYDMLNNAWIESGCKTTESYTNKSGATNVRKTALYLSIEYLRKELLELENVFGLTPKGLKAIKAKGLEKNTASKFEEALSKLEK